MNCTLTELEWPDRWFFDGDACAAAGADTPPAVGLLPSTARDADVAAVDAMFASVGDIPYPADGDDISARAWMQAAGCGSDRSAAIAEACYANDFGASLDALGLTELITENRLWDSGETYLVPDRPLSALVDHLAAGVPTIRARWPVERVCANDKGEYVELTGPAGTLRARRVIMTIPLALLQRNRVAFDPPLPPAKTDAIARLRVGAAIKLVLTFGRRVWPADFFDAVCPGSPVPEWWVKRYPVDVDDTSSTLSTHAITGFLCGAFAERARAAGRADALACSLAQLDTMFATPADPHPASSAHLTTHWVDWDDEPWAGGAYSHPSLGARVGDRDALAAPCGRLFWAGEATHPAVNPCLQAAYETGVRAAREVSEACDGDGVEGAAREVKV